MAHRQSPPERAAALERALACLDAYGADPSRWPAEDADLFKDFAGDAGFEAALSAAHSVDRALALSPQPLAGDMLRDAILAEFDSRSGGFSQKASPGGLLRLFKASRLIPAGAVAGLSALGFLVGAATAGGAELTPDDPLYYAQAGFPVSSEEEDAFWAVN